MYYKVTIDETSRNTPKDESTRFNQEVTTHKTLDEVRKYLAERYGGKIPERRARNTVYVDGKDGKGQPVGFLHSYWNADLSHAPVDKWYQTDWVCVTEVNETPVLVN